MHSEQTQVTKDRIDFKEIYLPQKKKAILFRSACFTYSESKNQIKTFKRKHINKSIKRIYKIVLNSLIGKTP